VPGRSVAPNRWWADALDTIERFGLDGAGGQPDAIDALTA